jgi:hypothetical protein
MQMSRLMGWTAAIVAAGLATAGVAAERRNDRGEAELAKLVAGRTAGAPVKCLTLSEIQNSTIIDGTAIVYRTTGNRLYVNRPFGASLLRDDDIPVEHIWGSQLCRLDQIGLLDRNSRFNRGTVGLGDFIPYSKPPKNGR